MTNEERFRKLGLNIAYYRKEKGMSQMELAEHIGISRTHMSRIENNECSPSLDTLFNIADALSVNISEFFIFR